LTSPADFKKRLNHELPEGLEILGAALISNNEKSLNNIFSRYEYEVTIDNALEKHIISFIDRENCLVAREKKTVDIRPMVEKAEVNGNILHLFLIDTEGAKARLHEILGEMLQQTTGEVQSLIIKRISLYGYNSNVNQGSLVRK
jgi:uncharacterized protein (DUF2344 family)